MRSYNKFLFCPVCQGGRLPATLLVGAFLLQIGAARGDTFTVTNTADGGTGTLRWAITNANANSGKTNYIYFNIAGTAPHTINLSGALPSVTNSWTIIDATTQPDYAGTPTVELNGTGAGSSSVGLQLSSAFNSVSGLAINSFHTNAILLTGVSNVIQGNFIGTDTTGTIARGNGSYGIWVGSSGNRIGGSKAFNLNVISGNKDNGIYIDGNSNLVQGNYIGVSATGAGALGNTNNGIMIYGGSGNMIGGGTPGARNIISGNGTNGIFLAGAGIVGNIVAGNYIGTDASGKLALANGNDGVTITSGGNLIGTNNVISGNRAGGVFLTGGASGNLVQGNLIGLSVDGTNALPNTGNGIETIGASSNTIGGNVAAARNVISGNVFNGVLILMVTDVSNAICGNYIGTDVTGKKVVANSLAGIHIEGCSNVVGGVTAGSGNLISGNGQQGIYLLGTNGNVFANLVQGNLIGLDATGAAALGNGNSGITINGAANNQIGGTTSAARNVISANGSSSSGYGGISLINAGATGNQLQGNYIGTDVSGTVALGNVFDGIDLFSQSATNFIGGTAAGAGNLISANGQDGIYLTNASWNVIQGNYIGTKADGNGALGNALHNVELQLSATNNTIGGSTPGAGNRIAFAKTTLHSGVLTPYSGVRVRAGSLNNLISGNSIFSNAFFGIDLGTAGFNANVDCESGVAANAANRGQNYPVLTNVYSGSATQIRGAFDSGAGKTYLLQFFSSPSGNTNGYGEGQVFLGQTNVTLSATMCSSNFTVLLPVSVPVGWVVTATATDPVNNTSEFSAWVSVLIVPQLLSTAVSPANQQFSMSWTNNGGNYALQQAFSLSPPQVWTTVTNAPQLTNGLYSLTLSATNGDAFYRLQVQ